VEHVNMRPKQRAHYVSLDDPTTIQGYVDELCQNMGEEHLRLHTVLPIHRDGNTVGFWLFFTRLGESHTEV
jgi:hypothetical protein